MWIKHGNKDTMMKQEKLNKAAELRSRLESLNAELEEVKNLPAWDKSRAGAILRIMSETAQVVAAHTALWSGKTCECEGIGPSDSGNGVIVFMHTNSESSKQ